MNESKLSEAATFYKKTIETFIKREGLAISPLRLDPDLKKVSKDQMLNHLLWLAEEIPNLISQNRITKAMRWLGFIQGSLWASGLATIAEAKHQNHSI